MMIDLRSDTFTKPGPGMLEAMFRAEVGDDVFGEDPTVNQLEAFAAGLFSKEAALFCPSGTMTNQIAIKCHTNPGEEVICEKLSHVYIYEAGGIAFNSNCQVKALPGDRGRITADEILEAINPDDIHRAPTALVTLENTANRGGGSCYEHAEIERIKAVCHTFHLKLHMDGARLFNAAIATGFDLRNYGQIFDSISICLSKGLGAPVGSLLLGNRSFITKARKVRKIFGGGMRQAGFLAAAGIYALENNINRLAEDHQHAHDLATALIRKDFVGRILPVETNILIFEVKGRYAPKTFATYLRQHEIYCMPISPTQVRMVTHLDVTKEMLQRVIALIEKM